MFILLVMKYGCNSSGESDRMAWKSLCGCIGKRDGPGETIVDTVPWTFSCVNSSERQECLRYTRSPKCLKKSAPKIEL